jgi:hypothetical protein
MNKTVFLTLLLLTGASTEAHAANIAVLFTAPNLFNIVVLGLAVVGTVGSFKVYSLVRGGGLSRSWLFFAGGFVVLGLSQLLFLLDVTEVAELPSFVAPAVVAVAAGLILYGIWDAKRILG